jgi:hypothetical protein
MASDFRACGRVRTIAAIALGIIVASGPDAPRSTLYAGASRSTSRPTARVRNLPAKPLPGFSRVYVILMENEELTDVIGSPSAPYINGLAAQYGVAKAYTAVTHPSLPNYMALTSGGTQFTTNCSGCVVDVANIADRVESAGRTWKGYMESMPVPCLTTDSGLYAQRHNPFVHYADIVNDSARCNAHVVPFTRFASDLQTGTLPAFTWITPNVCSDMHDCGIATGDQWLSQVVPQIMGTPDFGSSVLFIVWDEGATNTGGGGVVPLVVVSPMVHSIQSTQAANHYDLLRTMTDWLDVAPLGLSTNGRDLTEYFAASVPDFKGLPEHPGG